MRPLFILILGWLVLSSACYSEEPTALPDPKDLGVVPLTAPDRERGATLFTENCAPCHGIDGRGDGWRVAELNGPRPRDFHDQSMMLSMSPARAYLAITNGVSRTSMSAFDLLPTADRWHLAFFVTSQGYETAAAAQGKIAFEGLGMIPPTSRSLAELSNKAITDDLESKLDATTAGQAVAYLRRIAPYERLDAPLAGLRTTIEQAITAYRKGDHSLARQLLKEGHLDELKSQLTILRLRDAGLALAAELEIRSLRSFLQAGVSIREIEDRAQTLFASMDMADEILSRPLSAGVGAAQSASIALSYTLDGALGLFLLLVLGTRRGCDRRERKSVGLGLLVGLVLAVAAWLAWASVGDLLPGILRTTLTLGVSGAVALLSIPLLFGVIHHFRWPPQSRIHAAPSWLLLLFALSASIIVRDALEVVPSINLIASYSPAALLGFVGAGIAVIGIVSLLVSVERRLGPGMRIALISTSTTALAVISAGSATRTAQDLGLLGASAAGNAQSPWLAFWPTAQGILVQLIFAAACFGILLTLSLLRQEPS